mmetsp:Transcript_2090/g.4808  ORF Transcript_2090/g.4808 Transcript_2090/m.4808 type:complete len:212 (+) Transcript_2090:476-1111(+)
MCSRPSRFRSEQTNQTGASPRDGIQSKTIQTNGMAIMDAMTDLHCDGFPQKLRGLLGQVRQLEEQLSLGRDVLHNAGDLLLVVLAPGRTGGWMSIDGWIFFPFPLRQEGLVQVGVPSGGLPRQDGFRPVAEGNQTGLKYLELLLGLFPHLPTLLLPLGGVVSLAVAIVPAAAVWAETRHRDVRCWIGRRGVTPSVRRVKSTRVLFRLFPPN